MDDLHDIRFQPDSEMRKELKDIRIFIESKVKCDEERVPTACVDDVEKSFYYTKDSGKRLEQHTDTNQIF